MSAKDAIGLGCLLAGLCGLCGAVWIDPDLALAGTGHAALAAGVVVALVATLASGKSPLGLPQDAIGAVARVGWFAAQAFLVALVLAPGGAWLFVELLLLLVLLARRDATRAWLGFGGAAFATLVAALAFKLWILHQGSEGRWQVASVPVPLVSALPFEALEPLRAVELGQFTADELGLPPAGLGYGLVALLLVVGFACGVAATALCAHGAREHEDDRIDDLLRTLPAPLARSVQALVPEREWEALGLHGLPERKLARRLEELARERARALEQARLATRAPEVQAWLALEPPRQDGAP
ncbi:MAG: hypothetical protein RL112_439 [Planctomycetota bacterium]